MYACLNTNAYVLGIPCLCQQTWQNYTKWWKCLGLGLFDHPFELSLFRESNNGSRTSSAQIYLLQRVTLIWKWWFIQHCLLLIIKHENWSGTRDLPWELRSAHGKQQEGTELPAKWFGKNRCAELGFSLDLATTSSQVLGIVWIPSFLQETDYRTK